MTQHSSAPPATAVTGLDRATVLNADGSAALTDVSLLAEPGELLAVVGPSGSGKSTLLRAIAGLAQLRSGRVLIAGRHATGEPGTRNVAMVFQDDHLIPFLDVARNMSFPLDVRHTGADQSRAAVRAQAKALRLTRLLARKPGTLSHGERARVSAGRTLVQAPRAFLLDEPLTHLDPADRDQVRHHLQEIVKHTGVTTFYVTNDQTEALASGERVAVLNEGRVVQVASPRLLYAEPANTFVAGFVAAAPLSVLPATLVESAGMAGFQVGSRTLPTWLPTPAALAGHRGRPVLVGLRAEDVYTDPRPEHGTLTGVVTGLELRGSHAIVRLCVGENLLYARCDAHCTLRPGCSVTVGIDAARAHVFEPSTGCALAHPPRPL